MYQVVIVNDENIKMMTHDIFTAQISLHLQANINSLSHVVKLRKSTKAGASL